MKAPDDWENMLTWQQELKKHVESFQSQLTTTILEDFPAKSTQLIVELEKAGKSTQNILEFFVYVLGNHATSDVIRLDLRYNVLFLLFLDIYICQFKELPRNILSSDLKLVSPS